MAKTALRVKAARKPKFAVRGYTRCQRCGRPKAVYRKFGLCRICLREMAHRGELPGVHQVQLVTQTPRHSTTTIAEGRPREVRRETTARKGRPGHDDD